MIFQLCKNCGGEHYHEVIEQIYAKNVMFIESRCKNCSAITTSRFKTEVLYEKVLIQTKLLLEQDNHELNFENSH